MSDKIIDPNWIRKAPAWKLFLAKLFGKKVAGFDDEHYAVSYQFLGKIYYAGWDPKFKKLLEKKAKEGRKFLKWWMALYQDK